MLLGYEPGGTWAGAVNLSIGFVSVVGIRAQDLGVRGKSNNLAIASVVGIRARGDLGGLGQYYR